MKRLQRIIRSKGAAFGLLAVLGLGMGWETIGDVATDVADSLPMRYTEGVLLGKLPPPVEPSLIDPLEKAFRPKPSYKLMTVRHIPRIKPGGGMPHPYVGECNHCHLYQGGPGPGSQPKTPVGAVLEDISQLWKLGPPLKPNSQQPHPPAGRCIKCHDIVVKVPLDKSKSGFRWSL